MKIEDGIALLGWQERRVFQRKRQNPVAELPCWSVATRCTTELEHEEAKPMVLDPWTMMTRAIDVYRAERRLDIALHVATEVLVHEIEANPNGMGKARVEPHKDAL